MLETYVNLGYNVYGFGCKTKFEEYPENVFVKMKNRIFGYHGVYSFSLTEIINFEPKLNNLQNKIGFVGSKWGKIGRGNVDAWDKYILPLEKHFEFNKFGGLDSKMVSDNDMKKIYQNIKYVQ